MARPMLVAHALCKSYRRGDVTLPVLQNLDVTIGQGERVSIVGASGAGKSTLLHVLGTLDAPDAGRLTFEGEPLTGRSAVDLAAFRNRQLGFVFQFHHLLPDFDACENVMMPALVARESLPAARARAHEALALVGLSARMSHRPKALSGGEQQRVALARAIVMRPPLLLLDEVTGNLDAKTAEGIHALLLHLNETLHTTLVVVTHNPALAALMSTQLQLSDGRLSFAAGAPADKVL